MGQVTTILTFAEKMSVPRCYRSALMLAQYADD